MQVMQVMQVQGTSHLYHRCENAILYHDEYGPVVVPGTGWVSCCETHVGDKPVLWLCDTNPIAFRRTDTLEEMEIYFMMYTFTHTTS